MTTSLEQLNSLEIFANNRSNCFDVELFRLYRPFGD